MDEPTASLDFGNQIRVLEKKIKQLQHQNIVLTDYDSQSTTSGLFS